MQNKNKVTEEQSRSVRAERVRYEQAYIKNKHYARQWSIIPAIVVQIGHDVSGNFNIRIWACPEDFIVRNR